MVFNEKTIILKDGRNAVLKSPSPEDAEKLLKFIRQACGETDFLARYPEEWDITAEQEAAWINNLRSSSNTLPIACYVDREIVGNCELSFLSGQKMSHRATVAIAILRDCWGLGIGSVMFRELIAAAEKRGTEIMELDYIEGNERARHLYEKFGFRIIAEKPKAIKLKDGTYLRQIEMQKNL